MKETFVVNAEFREGQGKSASRRLRHAGKVPAILYGGKEAPRALALNHFEMMHHLETEAFYSHILTLKVGAEEQQAVLKDVQRHPAKPLLMHFDFQRIFADQAIHMQVPLHFTGEEISPGVKTNGGVVEHHLNQVEVECLPGQLPEFINVDMSAMDIDDTVHLSDLKIPEGVILIELRHGNDAAVAAIHLPRVVIEEAPVVEEAVGEVPASAQKTDGEAKPEADAKAGDKKK